MAILDDWLADLPEQFQGQENIEVFIKAYARQLEELKAAADELLTKTDIDTAEGKNLDLVGTIIPLTRKEAGELDQTGTKDPVMSDDRYRAFLRYKNLCDTSKCTYYDLMDGIHLLWGVSPVYYSEDPDYPATIFLTMPTLKPGGEPTPLGVVPMIRPAGVQIEFIYWVKATVVTMANIYPYLYDLLRCGTFVCGTKPRRGTLGEIVYGELNTTAEEVIAVFEQTLAGTTRLKGVAYRAVRGQLVSIPVEVTINRQWEIVDLALSGQKVSGQYPVKMATGALVKAFSESVAQLTNGTGNPPITGTRPRKSAIAATVEGGASVSMESDAYSYETAKAGTTTSDSGDIGETITESAGASKRVYLHRSAPSRCGTSVSGK